MKSKHSCLPATHSCIPDENTIQLQPFMAIQLKHFKRLRYYLKNKLDANSRDFEGQTLLMRCCEIAAEETALRFVELLLKHGARIEKCDRTGTNSLHKAVCSGHSQVVARLLEHAGNFNVNAQDFHGNTALMCAVKRGDCPIAEQLIKVCRKYDLSVDVSNSDDLTPLIQAAILKHDAIAERLVTMGRASEQARDMYFGKSAGDWKTPKDTIRLPALSQKKRTDPLMDPMVRSAPPRWPDLSRAYSVYEQELASSYRKGSQPRVKTPPPEPSFDEEWGKTRRRKERRHTIALSASLPANLSGKFAMARRNSVHERRRSSAFFPSEVLGKASIVKQNSSRRRSDSHVPCTAPAGLPFRSYGDWTRGGLTHSASMFSLNSNSSSSGLNMLQSPGRARRGSLRSIDVLRLRNSNTNSPIYEHEEHEDESVDYT